MVTLRGNNDFYDGWLDGVFNCSIPPDANEDYTIGRSTASDVQARGIDPLEVLRTELQLGHVLVQER